MDQINILTLPDGDASAENSGTNGSSDEVILVPVDDGETSSKSMINIPSDEGISAVSYEVRENRTQPQLKKRKITDYFKIK